MEMIRPHALTRQALVLLVSGGAGGGLLAGRLVALGAGVVVMGSLGAALAGLLEGGSARRTDIGLLVIDCDHVGGDHVGGDDGRADPVAGIRAGYQAFDRLAAAGLRLPVMLVCSTCPEQRFPVGEEAPYHLRAPVSAVALRIGFEKAFARVSAVSEGALSESAVPETAPSETVSSETVLTGFAPTGSAGRASEKGRSRGGAPFRIQESGDAGVSRLDRITTATGWWRIRDRHALLRYRRSRPDRP